MQLPSEPVPGKPITHLWGALVVRCLRAFRVCSSPDIMVNTTPAGTTLSLRQAATRGANAFPWESIAFGYSLSNATCTIYSGSIRMHGLAVYPLAAATPVTLTGATPWVFLSVAVGAATGTAPTVAVLASEPASTSTTLRIPLYRFSLVSGSTTYALARVHNLGDVNIAAPLR